MAQKHLYRTIILTSLLVMTYAFAMPVAVLAADSTLSLLNQIRLTPTDGDGGDVVAREPSPNVTAAVAPDSVTVGDPISVSVSVRVPKDVKVIPPETGDGFGDFMVLSWDSRRREDKDEDTEEFNYTLATFKPEDCAIPSLPYLTVADGDTIADTLWSRSFPIRVVSVIPQDLPPDSALDIRDLKDQQNTGRMGLVSLWIVLAIFAAIVLYYMIERMLKKKSADASVVPLKPPYEEAIELIDALEKKGLLMQGKIREHVFELSEIFKRYIGRRYNTIAPELTTEEIVNWLEFSGLSREMRTCAEWFFRESDHVKYAKQIPDSQVLCKFMSEVRKFLEATKPDPELQYEVKTQRMGAVE